MTDTRCFTGTAQLRETVASIIQDNCYPDSEGFGVSGADKAAELVLVLFSDVAQTSIIAPVESVGLRGAVKEALAEHASMLPPDWKQDQAETSRLQRKPTQGGDKGEAEPFGYVALYCGQNLFLTDAQSAKIYGRVCEVVPVYRAAAPQPTTAAYSAGNCGEEATYERANTIPVAWIAFAGNGNIRLWTSDEGRAKEEKERGLDLRAFTLAELVALIAKLPAWQDIDTAPIDGTHVLVIDEGIVSEAYFHIDEKSWWLAQTAPGGFDPSRAIYPTLWQPKPTPPSAVSSTDRGAGK